MKYYKVLYEIGTVMVEKYSASNWHSIGTVLLFPRKSISVILGTVKILHSSCFLIQGTAVFVRKVVVLLCQKI